MHPVIGRLLIAVGLTLLSSVSAWAAGPDNSEDICTQPYVIYCENFEARSVGPAWQQNYVPIYKNPGWGAYSYDCMQVTNDPAGVYDGTKAYVEIFYAGATTGCANIDIAFPNWLTTGTYTDLYFRWYVKESSNFQLSQVANKFQTWRDGYGNEGGHMSGMRYNTNTTVAAIGLGTYGWAVLPGGGTLGCDARALTPWPGYPVPALAGPGQQCELGPNENGPAPWVPGVWYCEEMHIKMNSCENCADGIIEKWLDNATAPVTTQTRHFYYPNSLITYPYNVYVTPPISQPAMLRLSGIVKMSFWNCAAGDLCCSANDPPNNTCYNASIGPGSPPSNPASIHPLMYRYTDNIVIATQRIGCLGNPVAPKSNTTPPSPPTNLQAL